LTRREAAILGAIAVTVAGCGGVVHPHVAAPVTASPAVAHSTWRGNAVNGPTAAPRFALSDQAGARVALAALVLVTFLYTHCPDICPLTARHLNAALRLLPRAARSRTRVLAVSVDPEGDTPAAVGRFIAEHRLLPQFRYLTGSRAALRPVWQAYNVLATPRNGDAIDHSAYTALVDRRGTIRVYFDVTTSPVDIAHDIRHALTL
jgi:protein SCO1/2